MTSRLVGAEATSTLLFARYPLTNTCSFEEARTLQSTINSPVEASVTDRREPFAWRANRVVFGGLGITASEYRAGVRGHTKNVHEQYSLVMPLAGGSRSSQHGSTVVGNPGRTAVMLSPGRPADFEVGTGYRGLQISVPAQMIETAMTAITGESWRTPLRYEVAVDLTSDGGAAAARLLDFIVSEAEREGGGLHAPMIAGRLVEAFAYSLVLGLPHDHAATVHRPVPAVELRYVRRAEELIVANLSRQLSMSELASEVGISARTLFAAFRTHRGYSPTAFMRARRMELARSRLLAGTATSVTEVALACGFEHLGRFSTRYRACFGESPRETLRRHRPLP